MKPTSQYVFSKQKIEGKNPCLMVTCVQSIQSIALTNNSDKPITSTNSSSTHLLSMWNRLARVDRCT